jgi:hypothetical protein
VTGRGQGLDRRRVDHGAGQRPGDHAADDLRDPVRDRIAYPDRWTNPLKTKSSISCAMARS